MRPPPKKRAKEFTNSEEISTVKHDPTSESGTPDTSPIKKTQVKKKKKKYSVKPIVVENIQHLVAELEKRSASIPENERQFICDLCSNEFVFPKRSITHVIKTHDVHPDNVYSFITVRKRENTPKVCDICGYTTKDQNFYYIHYHKYFRHGVPLPQGWKPYKCEICGKECFTKFQLKDHKLIHIEDTPFVCEICGQGFKSRTCLNSHVFHRHSSVRKHECGECQKTFKTKTQLLVHVRTHTGEKPFHCPECTYKSTTRGNMRLHLTNRHKLDSQQIKNMMYQIQTMSKAFTTPDAETSENILTSESQEMGIIENVRLPVVTVETSRQQETVEVNNFTATLENIMSTSQQSNQVVYREPTLAERQILFQSLGGHQPGAENTLNQGQGQVVCQEQEVGQQETETQVILPEHLHNHQIIVQHDQANGDGTLVWDPARAAFMKVNNGSITLIQDTRELQSQEQQPIQILNTRSIIQEQHPEVTRTLQEPDHALVNEGNRLHSVQGQGQQFTTDRQILDQAQSLIQGRHFEFQQQDPNVINTSNQKQDSHLHTLQQNQLHINRNQLIEIPVEVIGRHTALNVQPQLGSNRHTDIQTQDPTVLGDAGSLHSQEQTQSIVFKDNPSLFEGGAQNTTKSVIGQSQVPLPRKQQLASLSLGGPITLNYHTNVPVTSSKTPTSQTYLVDTQNIITSIESARQISQQNPVATHTSSHTLDTTVVQQPYDPATTVSSQSYTDTNNMIYQYYQQYQQGS